MEAADIIILQLVFVHLEAMSCMDLLLRWVVIRICDANTQALLRILDLTKALFNLMISKASFSCLDSRLLNELKFKLSLSRQLAEAFHRPNKHSNYWRTSAESISILPINGFAG